MKWVLSAGVAAVHVTEKMSLLATGANKSRAETADARTTGRHAVARAVAIGPEWQLQTLSLIFMGWGFYMIHGSLQVFASELSAEARATALSLHAFFFFMGQTIGPIAYGFGIQHVGKVPTLLTAAAVMIALGFVCAKLLRQTRPADAAAT